MKLTNECECLLYSDVQEERNLEKVLQNTYASESLLDSESSGS